MIPVNAISHRRARARGYRRGKHVYGHTRRIAAADFLIYVRDCVVIGFGHDNDLKIGVFGCILNREPIVGRTTN